MYAIIRSGGKQAKVEEGDVLDVERIKGDGDVTFTPLLVVDDDGTVIADRATLETVTVSAEVLGASAGPKIDIFKYKNKSGYRRRMGHRQKYTRIQVTTIEIPGREKPKQDEAAAAEAVEDEIGETTPEAATTAVEPVQEDTVVDGAAATGVGAAEGVIEEKTPEAATTAVDPVQDDAVVDEAAAADEEA